MSAPSDLRWQKIQAHQKDVHAIIARDFSASRMNTTKWREVADCLVHFLVLITAKFVDIKEVIPVQGFWHVTGDWFDSNSPGPFTSIQIEWMSINPMEHVWQGSLLKPTMISYADELERCLQAASIPYSWENDCIRIVGHVRNQ